MYLFKKCHFHGNIFSRGRQNPCIVCTHTAWGREGTMYPHCRWQTGYIVPALPGADQVQCNAGVAGFVCPDCFVHEDFQDLPDPCVSRLSSQSSDPSYHGQCRYRNLLNFVSLKNIVTELEFRLVKNQSLFPHLNRIL